MPQNKKTVLIVDDVPENLDVLKGILAPDYLVKAAISGKLALRIAEKQPPDIVLLDVMMPEMDGYEVCRILKANPKTATVPVIFITAKTDTIDQEFGFDVGAVDYITKPVIPSIVQRRIKTHLSLVRVEELYALARSAIRMLGEAGHYNDSDTGRHIWRMASYSRAIAKQLGWSEADAEMLELAAQMHDTGKIGIPDHILKAPRKLTDEEWATMQSHTIIGQQILSHSENPVFILSAEIAACHHEKWDGSGYPRKLKGEQIPMAARIVAVADVFDALTMDRPYKRLGQSKTRMAISAKVPAPISIRKSWRRSWPSRIKYAR